MEQLSSCYFCGGALDASLDEYPVVPESLQPAETTGGTIVLCQTCKRKLDAVVESVVDAAETVDAGTQASPNSRDADTGTASSGAADIESTLGDDEDVLRPVSEEEPESSGDGKRASSGDGRSSASADASSSGTDDSRTYSGGRRAGHNTTSADDEGDGGSDDDADDEPKKSEVTLTRLENTKVMRLLQNREFPVDREDFVTVASSAYEISRSDCDKVIDLAIEHDLLDERKGQLVAGSRWG